MFSQSLSKKAKSTNGALYVAITILYKWFDQYLISNTNANKGKFKANVNK